MGDGVIMEHDPLVNSFLELEYLPCPVAPKSDQEIMVAAKLLYNLRRRKRLRSDHPGNGGLVDPLGPHKGSTCNLENLIIVQDRSPNGHMKGYHEDRLPFPWARAFQLKRGIHHLVQERSQPSTLVDTSGAMAPL